MWELAGLAECLAAPPPFPADAARGQGEPIIVLPGFCAPNFSTTRLRDFLLRQGFTAQPWDLGINLGPTRVTLASLARQIENMAKEHDARVSLVGLSLGGTIAREMAKRHPDLVARVITLVSPIRLPVATPLAPLAQLAATMWDSDARAEMEKIAEPPPVPVTAIVSQSDGLVDWRSCVPDPAPNVEMVTIDGMHTTMGSNPEAQRVVAARIAGR